MASYEIYEVTAGDAPSANAAYQVYDISVTGSVATVSPAYELYNVSVTGTSAPTTSARLEIYNISVTGTSVIGLPPYSATYYWDGADFKPIDLYVWDGTIALPLNLPQYNL